ncbi:hypothetical protein WDZ92_49925, partial [Nostoc sp. NIES-2111]
SRGLRARPGGAGARAGEGCADIGTVMPQAGRAGIAGPYKRLAGSEPSTLNAGPSLSPPRKAA